VSDRPDSNPIQQTAASHLQADGDIYIGSITQIVNQSDAPKPAESPQISLSIDALVEQVRSLYRDKIQYECGTMQLLDVSHPVALDNLYVDVNMLDKIPSQRWVRISDRLQDFDPSADDFDRFYLGLVLQARVPGLEAANTNPKLMVLGKPGAGKTTFLKHLAIECNKGNFQADRVPIFIRLKRYADDAIYSGNFDLLNYISQSLQTCDVAATDVESLLKHGRALILLDGLDEVPEQDGKAIRQQIIWLCERYYKNQFAITCRTQAQKYRFDSFTNVEVADFYQEQIESFAKKWFVAVARNLEEKGLAKATEFIEKLKQPENKRVRELSITPILLSLTCLVFNDLQDLPTNRSKLYEQGLNILVSRWDEARGIERDEIYRNLTLPHKLKLLSQIAAITFEQGDYFFEQGKIQQLIAGYLCILPDAETDPDSRQLASESVLKSIEVQHGLLIERAREIYSFSHLTFQEYFTAKEIVARWIPQASEYLASHVIERRWREVFLLSVGMLRNSDNLLLLRRQQIGTFVASFDEKLQQFLIWVNDKSLLVEVPYRLMAVRAFYFALALDIARKNANAYDRSLDIAHSLDLDLAHSFARAYDLDSAFARAFYDTSHIVLARALVLDVILERGIDLDFTLNCTLDIILDRSFVLDPELKLLLQQLKEPLPNWDDGFDMHGQWWNANGQAWTEQLRAVMIEHRNIGHDWQFSEQQKELLKQYYDANKLLVDCLNSGCEVAPKVRQEIEEMLLLPTVEIDR